MLSSWVDGKNPLRKVKLRRGSSFPCEQNVNLEEFRVNKVSCQIFQLL